MASDLNGVPRFDELVKVLPPFSEFLQAQDELGVFSVRPPVESERIVRETIVVW